MKADAATNSDPDVFAYAAATVKTCLDMTYKLGGDNYVLWGAVEKDMKPFSTSILINLAQEEAQLGRFINLVVACKHKIDFKDDVLIELKPQEPTKY